MGGNVNGSVYLLDGRLRSVEMHSSGDNMFRYRNNNNMSPDWRNQRWIHQDEQTEVAPRVIVGSLASR